MCNPRLALYKVLGGHSTYVPQKPLRHIGNSELCVLHNMMVSPPQAADIPMCIPTYSYIPNAQRGRDYTRLSLAFLPLEQY